MLVLALVSLHSGVITRAEAIAAVRLRRIVRQNEGVLDSAEMSALANRINKTGGFLQHRRTPSPSLVEPQAAAPSTSLPLREIPNSGTRHVPPHAFRMDLLYVGWLGVDRSVRLSSALHTSWCAQWPPTGMGGPQGRHEAVMEGRRLGLI
jgi:hypothetical protein